jgi:hypothetical protein
MKMPDVTGGFADLWNYVKIDRPHRIPAMGVAIVLPIVIFYLFAYAMQPEPDTRARIVYIENWSADRNEQDIRREWLERAKATNARHARNREAYKRLADSMGVEYDSTEADRDSAATDAIDPEAMAKAQLDAAESYSRQRGDAAKGE